MNIRLSQTLPRLAKQRGAVTLLVVLILLIGMTMLSLTTLRTGMVEQQITGNDMRAREAFEGSEAGIEYGLAYLTNNSGNYSNYNGLSWTTTSILPICVGFQCSNPPASGNIGSGNFSYTPNITYKRVPASDYIRVVSASTETNDNTIKATNEQYVEVLKIAGGGIGGIYKIPGTWKDF